jgi:hypothetical protein
MLHFGMMDRASVVSQIMPSLLPKQHKERDKWDLRMMIGSASSHTQQQTRHMVAIKLVRILMVMIQPK